MIMKLYGKFVVEEDDRGNERFILNMPAKTAKKLINASKKRINDFQYRLFIEYKCSKEDYNSFCKIDHVWRHLDAEGWDLPFRAESAEILKVTRETDNLLFSKLIRNKLPCLYRIQVGNRKEVMEYRTEKDLHMMNEVNSLFDIYQKNKNMQEYQGAKIESESRRKSIEDRIEKILGRT